MNEQDRFEAYSRKQSQKAKERKLIIGICIGLGVLFVLAMLASLIFSMWSVVRRAELQTIPGYDYDYGGNGYFGYDIPYDDSQSSSPSGYYVPSPDDKYYQELTDATDRDLSYTVLWQSAAIRPDDPNLTYKYDCSYPVLTGKTPDKEKLTSINATIEQIACEYQESYEDYDGGVLSYGFVTYMDEEKISVVIRHSLNDGNKTDSIVRAVTFSMDTGEVIPHSDMVDTDEYLVYQFRSRNTYQNGEVEFVESLSDEELLEYLLDEEDSIMFYTPVGLEIGFNFDGGWVTVTLKSYVV